MQPEIKTLSKKLVVGIRIRTCLADDSSGKLWQQFMPRKKEIMSVKGKELYSMQEYSQNLNYIEFTPETIFTKWAAIEVSEIDKVPKGMESHVINGGLYAVFKHKGTTETFQELVGHIYGEWLPNTDYELDQREHFEVLGSKYKGPLNPDSEEDVWIPIK